jgi:hypothetical protein
MSHLPQLRLLSHPISSKNHTSLHSDVDSARLWDLLRDTTVHTILKRSALAELARRRDPGLMEYCEQLLSSESRSDWCLGISTLSALGTPEAVDRLISAFAKSLGENRRYVLESVASILTADFVRPFSIMVREVACSGELDVSSWTRIAISTLSEVCKRFGIETVIEGAPSPTEEPTGAVLLPMDP